MQHLGLKVIFVLLSTFSGASNPDERQDQQAYLVYDHRCITAVNVTPATELSFPMVNGEPDKKHGLLLGAVAVYDPRCGFSYYRIKPVGPK